MVSNTANIYFDLNPAVVTAPAECTVQSDVTGLAEHVSATLSLAPNPTTGHVLLVLNNAWGPDVILTVSDASGRRMRQQLGGSKSYEVDLSGSSPGLLHIELSDGHQRRVTKVVKL